MDSNNKRDLLKYIIISGIFFYFLHAMLQSIFIITVPMDKDWGTTIEVDGKTYVDHFKNDLELRKYYYNLDMNKRNDYLLIIEFILSNVITWMIFYYIPKWKRNEIRIEKFTLFLSFGAVSFVASIVFVYILKAALPAPSEWFPSIFINLHSDLVNEALKKLQG